MQTETTTLEDRLRRDVEHLSWTIGPRHLEQPEKLRAAQGYLEKELQKTGMNVMTEPYSVGAQRVANVIVEWTGSRRPKEIVLVGAHYDSVVGSPGADDNASAVAVLLELARQLSGRKFQRTVRFVFFTCEEAPHFHLGEMGSQIHARGCRERNESIRAMLCLEMLGFFTDAPQSQRLPPGIPTWLHGFFPTRGNFLAAVANPRSWWLLVTFRFGFKRACGFPLWTLVLPETIHDIRRSDHSSFWDRGYPALMLTDTSYLRNPHYHQPSDTSETLDYSRMAMLLPGLAGALTCLAGKGR